MSAAPARNWWHSAKCRDYINARIAPVPGSLGPVDAVRSTFPGRRFARAVSVGCGTGAKELLFLREGLADRFDLWDIAEKRLAAGRAEAERLGLADRATFRAGDAFRAGAAGYDLIHWDHSLHHMADVRGALAWSRSVAAPGAVILVNDYVGPERLQYPRDQTHAANDFLRRHDLPTTVRRSTPLTRLRMWLKDPSEAPQSTRIMAAVAETGQALRPIGGMFLNILGPHVPGRLPDDDPRIDALIAADRAACDAGRSHFAFGLLT